MQISFSRAGEGLPALQLVGPGDGSCGSFSIGTGRVRSNSIGTFVRMPPRGPAWCSYKAKPSNAKTIATDSLVETLARNASVAARPGTRRMEKPAS
jgi:hypothetical protein